MKEERGAMNSLQRGAITLLAACCILVGCGDSQKAKTDTRPDEREAVIADLQSEVAETRERLASQESENSELAEQIQSLKKQLSEAESGAETSSRKEEEKGKTSRAGGEDQEDQSRIGLIGAKALAEYKAAKLAERLQTLTGDLQRKEKEMESIRQAASVKDADIAKLRKTIEELKETDKTRTAELNAKFEQIRKELAERASDAEKLKKDLDEKTGLLQTLKAAVGDASKLKSTAEAEVARLQSALDQTTKSLQEVQSQSQRLHQDLQGLQAYADQTVHEREQCRAEAETLRREMQQQYTMAHNLAAQVAELTSRLQVLSPTAQASTDDEPSSVDLVLQVPMRAAESENGSKLY